MDSVNLEVIRRAVAWIAAGKPATLATVVKTWGSAPRPPGALLAICEGQLVGSVSGGCIEDDLLDRWRNAPPTCPEIVTYGVTAEQTHRFGLPCGGNIQLVLEPLHKASRLTEALQRLDRGELVARRLDLAGGKAELLAEIPAATVIFDDGTLTTVFGPRWRILIVGAGQLSSFIARFSLALDYQVTITEPREEYRTSWDIPGITLTGEMPDDAVRAMRPDRRTIVIAASHDPKLDDLALIEALSSDAFYVGAIGSRVTSARRRERLKLFDLDDSDLARLHGPVGLPIGSRTPAEIALAIVADIAARRNGIELIARSKPGLPESSSVCPIRDK